MDPKPSTPWTAGRSPSPLRRPVVRCEGGRCTWSAGGGTGASPAPARLKTPSVRRKRL